MTARTHDAFAFAFLITIAAYFPPESINVLTLFSGVLAADIGALLPDLDGAGNRLWDLLPHGDRLGKILRRVFYKHRTITHSLLGFFAIYKFFEWLLPKFLNPSFIDPNIVFACLMIGYVSHLLADSFTEEGLPLLFPLRTKFGIPPIEAWRMKTGKWFENFVVFPGLGVYLIWFIYNNQEKLIHILRSTGS
jgi:inner membrane protein